MSRRPKGGMGGARKKVGKQEPLVSEAWGTLATTCVSMLETVGSLNEEANDDCIEEAAQLTEMNKKRMGAQDRLQLLDAVTQLIENFMGAFADLDDEARDENGIGEMVENFYGSLFSIITESIEGVNKEEASEQAKEQLQQQLCMCLRAIDTLMAVTFDNDEKSALTYFLPFAGTLFELCCAQLCLNKTYDFFVRQMALGLLVDQIEGGQLTPFLRDPANAHIVELIIDTCFKLCADPDKEDKEEGGDDEEEEDEENDIGMNPNEESSQNLGTQLLDTLTTSVNTEAGDSIVAPLILARSSAVLTKADAAPLDVKAALICLAVIPEAANKFAKSESYLAPVMAFLLAFAGGDKDAVVRSGAFIAMSEHVQHLQPQIDAYAEQILALIRTTLTDPVERSPMKVKSKAVLPLHVMSKALPASAVKPDSPNNIFRFLLDYIKPYASKSADELSEDDYDLLNELTNTLRTLADEYAEFVSEPAGTLVEQHGQYLHPFLAEGVQTCVDLAQHSEAEEAWVVRGQAVAAATLMAIAQGKEVLQAQMATLAPLLQKCIEAEPADAEEGESLDDEIYSVRQGVHTLWAVLADQLGAGVEPYLAAYLPMVVRAVDGEYGGAGGEEEEDEDGMPAPPSDNPARDEERTAALEAYRRLAQAMGGAFASQYAAVFDKVEEAYRAYSPSNMEAVADMLAVLPHALYPLGADVKPTAGQDLSLPEATLDLVKKCRSIALDLARHATSTDVVRSALDALSTMTERYGQVVFADDDELLKQYEKLCKDLVRGRAPCQTMDSNEIAYVDMENGFGFGGGFGGFGGGADGEDDEEDAEGEDEEEEEEEAEADEEEAEEGHVHGPNCSHAHGHGHGDEEQANVDVFEALLNSMGAVAKARGASFKPLLDAVWERLLKKRKAKGYDAAISGFLADLGDALPADVFAQYAKQVFPLLIATLTDAKSGVAVRRNTAYALGQMFLKSDVEATKDYYEAAVAGLEASLQYVEAAMAAHASKSGEEFDDMHGAKDNLIGCVGRMLMVGAEHLPRATLVPRFVAGLPLANDFSENQQVYPAVAKLVHTLPQSHPGIIEPLYPQLLRVFATVIADKQPFVSDKLQAFIVKTARVILAAQPGLRAEVVDKLDDKAKTAFVQALDAPADE